MNKTFWITGLILAVVAVSGFTILLVRTNPASTPTNLNVQSTPTVIPSITPAIITQPATISATPKSMNPVTRSATLKTSAGDIVIEFNSDQTPKTVQNFIDLANKGFYNNTIFHRTIKGFMIQGGDPEGTGRGGPGYRFDDEPFTGEYTRGTVAMANAGPNTNGSQFFIMHADYALPKNYVIFGKVTKGMETVDKIATAPTDPTGEGSRPVNPVKVLSVTISEK